MNPLGISYDKINRFNLLVLPMQKNPKFCQFFEKTSLSYFFHFDLNYANPGVQKLKKLWKRKGDMDN